MTSPEQNRNIELTSRPKPKIGKIIFAIVLIAVAAFFAKPYLGKETASDAPQQPQQQAPSVVISVAENSNLAVGREYIGRVEPIQSVSLKPHITGEIAQVHFKEGSTVRVGQLLFSIDAKEFMATVELRKADLAKTQANYNRASKYYERLKASDKRSISASDLDMAESDVLQGKADIEQAKASLKLAQINLGYTRITSPISGQIGKAYFTKGNYVTPSGGNLADIIQVNPIRVEFSLPDRDYLEQMEEFKGSDSSVYDATIRLADGEPYPFSGERDFENNTMDEKTGTIKMHLRFKNDSGILVPGSMVRVTTKPIQSHIAVVIPQEAIMVDREGDYVYVIDENNIAHLQRVKLGSEIASKREVISGLNSGEKIIVRGLQSVRDEMEVVPSPIKDANEAKTPAELAMESGYDLQAISDDVTSADKQEPTEGKN